MTDVEETPIYDPKTGQWQVQKRKDPAKLKANFLLSLGDDPNVEKELQNNFNEKYSDLDWEKEGRNKLATDMANLQSEIYLAESQGLDASPYKAALQEYQQIYNNPSLLGEPLKNNIYQIEKENFINASLKGAEAMSVGIPVLSDLTKLNLQQSQAIRLKQMDIQADKELASLKGEITANKANLPEEVTQELINIPANTKTNQVPQIFMSKQFIRDDIKKPSSKTVEVKDDKGKVIETKVETEEKLVKGSPVQIHKNSDGIIMLEYEDGKMFPYNPSGISKTDRNLIISELKKLGISNPTEEIIYQAYKQAKQ